MIPCVMLFLSTYLPAINIFKQLFHSFLTWMHMGKTYFVGCRIDKQLFTKIKTHDERSSTIVRKALYQYFREQEPNQTPDSYNKELIVLLNKQIEDLRQDKLRLNEQVNMLMLSSIPLLSRIKMKLLSR